MREHGVLGVADEGLDFEILFDPAEEDLDLPAFFVDVGDGLGRQPKVVGEKDINFPVFGVPVNDAAQRFGALSGFGAGKHNALVGHQILHSLEDGVLQKVLDINFGQLIDCSAIGNSPLKVVALTSLGLFKFDVMSGDIEDEVRLSAAQDRSYSCISVSFCGSWAYVGADDALEVWSLSAKERVMWIPLPSRVTEIAILSPDRVVAGDKMGWVWHLKIVPPCFEAIEEK